jgi:hypothetical protein
MKMKSFEITLKYTAYTNMTIEADTKEQAEKLAWDELMSDGSYGSYGEWELDHLEELK